MRNLVRFLKIASPIFLVVGALHLFLGAGAEVMLGAKLSADSLADPVLDSQNRFYGVAFTLYGVLLYVCATDLTKYRVIYLCVLGVFFAGGLARLVSILTHGIPSPAVLVLLFSEILVPPFLYWWLSQVQHEG